MEIENKIIEIVVKYCELENVAEILTQTGDLAELGINSISFIKIVVDLETEFDFEFEDEALDYSKFQKLDQLIDYIVEQVRLS